AVGGRGGDGGQGLGGGVFVQGLAVFTRSTISHNAAHGGARGRGGGGARGGGAPRPRGGGGPGGGGGGGGVPVPGEAGAARPLTTPPRPTNPPGGGDGGAGGSSLLNGHGGDGGPGGGSAGGGISTSVTVRLAFRNSTVANNAALPSLGGAGGPAPDPGGDGA